MKNKEKILMKNYYIRAGVDVYIDDFNEGEGDHANYSGRLTVS